MFLSEMTPGSEEDSPLYDRISITRASTGGGDGQAYDDVKPLSKEGQPAGIELTPCPAYLAVKSAATTGMENSMDETEYELPDNVAAGANQGPTDPTQH